MEIERELPPGFYQPEIVNQPTHARDNPTQWPDKPRRRELKRLVVEHDGPALERVSAEESLEDEKCCGEQERGQNGKAEEQDQLGFEDVPIDRRETERTKPQRRQVNREYARNENKQRSEERRVGKERRCRGWRRR